jgi:hypothetical protein
MEIGQYEGDFHGIFLLQAVLSSGNGLGTALFLALHSLPTPRFHDFARAGLLFFGLPLGSQDAENEDSHRQQSIGGPPLD